VANKKPPKKEIAAAEDLVAQAQAQLDTATASLSEPEQVDAARAVLDEATAALAALIEEINVIPPTRKDVVTVRAARDSDMWHPFQLRYITTQPQGVEVVKDGWVESQVKAGILEIVK